MSAPVPPWSELVGTEITHMRRAGSLSLVVADRVSGLRVLDALGAVLDARPTSITQQALTAPLPRTDAELLERLVDAFLLFDVESLCWRPWLRIEPLNLLRIHARHKGVIALWPGTVAGRVAVFSEPGRRDYVYTNLRDVTLLRPVATQFPDEVPFAVERITT